MRKILDKTSLHSPLSWERVRAARVRCALVALVPWRSVVMPTRPLREVGLTPSTVFFLHKPSSSQTPLLPAPPSVILSAAKDLVGKGSDSCWLSNRKSESVSLKFLSDFLLTIRLFLILHLTIISVDKPQPYERICPEGLVPLSNRFSCTNMSTCTIKFQCPEGLVPFSNRI